MKISYSWLKDHLETTASLDLIVDKLTQLGHEVESVEDPSSKYKGFVVAEVVSCEKHPQADRLSLCQVFVGSGEPLQVVCGAPNVKKGLKVAFAQVGVIIPASGQPLKKGVIRGIESFGMICSSEELLLEVDSQGIMELDSQLKPGADLAQALGLDDPVIDISITPNRSDCFSVRGLARDLAASGLGTLKPLGVYKPTLNESHQEIPVRIEEIHTLVPQFTLRHIKGIQNAQSPQWLQKRLKSIGQNSISLLVDITNYILFDLGRPMHVFDANKVKGSLTLRFARQGEKFHTLQECELTFTNTPTIVIADESAVLSLAGILGGSSSAVDESTQDVLVECAVFNPVAITRAAQHYQIHTESRVRFERGVDETLTHHAHDMFVQLLLDASVNPKSIGNIYGITAPQVTRTPILLSQEKLSKIAGYSIDLIEAKDILEKLECVVTKEGHDLKVIPPFHRHDFTIPEDLVEDVLRLKGFDKIPSIPLPLVKQGNLFFETEKARCWMANAGFHEAVTWSFTSNETALLFGGGAINLANPISVELSSMRPTILSTMINVIQRNQNRGLSDQSFFEIGPVYEGTSAKDSKQTHVLFAIQTGRMIKNHWSATEKKVDFFEMKGTLFSLLEDVFSFNPNNLQLITSDLPAFLHPGRSCLLKLGQKTIGWLGEVHPQVLANYSLPDPAVVFEIDLDALPSAKNKKIPYQPNDLQIVKRDFAFVVDKNVTVAKVIKAIQGAEPKLIQSLDVFDIYTGTHLPEDKKSLAISVFLQPAEKTFNESELQAISKHIVDEVAKQTGGVLR